MGERTAIRAWGYLFFALMMLIVNWESNLADAALVTPGIPQEAIRIRILAHSDSVQDQWIKKQVRDEIAAAFETWNEPHADIGEARRALHRRLPEFERIVGGLLTKYGFDYGYKVELGLVEFPAKTFDGRMYPAGHYEALLITLGEGRGENWWCVLFPPLCFGSGTVKAKADAAGGNEPEAGESAGSAGKAETSGNGESAGNAGNAEFTGKAGNADFAERGNAAGDNGKPEVRFFLLDSLKKVGSQLKGLFA